MIEIDGSKGEGGGQVLRTALGLSILSGKPFKITNIRANRPTPGLKAQHKFCIDLFSKLTECDTHEVSVGDTELEFTPGKIKAKNLRVDIGTAGSISLVLQSLMIPMLFADKPFTITIKGGTDVSWSPPLDYFINVIKPQLLRMAGVNIKIINRGFYPKGQGEVKIRVVPRVETWNSFEELKNEIFDKTKTIEIHERGDLIRIEGISFATDELQKAQVAERQAKFARMMLSKFNVPVEITTEYSSSTSIGSGIVLWTRYMSEEGLEYPNIILGADILGKKGIRAEDVGQDCARKLIDEMNGYGCVDEHLADNLIPYLGLLGGKIRVGKISNHTKTNIDIVEKFLDVKFTIDDELIGAKLL